MLGGANKSGDGCLIKEGHGTIYCNGKLVTQVLFTSACLYIRHMLIFYLNTAYKPVFTGSFKCAMGPMALMDAPCSGRHPQLAVQACGGVESKGIP